MSKDKRNPPFGLDMDFEEAMQRFGQTDPKEITSDASKINVLAPKSGSKEITKNQGNLNLEIEKETEISGIGMGVLNDGTPYLNQRGLSALCGVQNAHIGTISSQWNEADPKPRIRAVKAILAKSGFTAPFAHVELPHKGITHYCYPAEICLAILEYYAFDAGSNCQPEARDNFRLLAGSKLRELIYSRVGYDPNGTYNDRFRKWHERIELNHQSAAPGYFGVFNEAHTIIYELIVAGADIGEKFVVDISIGQHWSRFWEEHDLDAAYGQRIRYPHRYPDDHPQAKSNPQDAWCYPNSSLGEFRDWLRGKYIEGGKFKTYLDGKIKRGELPPSVAQLAIKAVDPPRIGT